MKSTVLFGVSACVVASLLSISILDTSARAGLIAADPFVVGGGGYSAGNLSGQSPTVAGFTGSWGGNTGTISAIATGLEYPGLDVAGGAARFTYGSNLSDASRYLSRPLAGYDYAQEVYYFSGLMSFDETFSTSAASYAKMGFVNTTSDGDAFGVQWGFKGNGDGVDALVRVRDYAGGTAMNEYVIASNIAAGTHMFVVKLEPDKKGTLDDPMSVWFNPANLSSEAAAGTPDWSRDTLAWVPGNPNYLVNRLMLKTFSVGAGAVVGFDEARMGTTWASVVPEPGSAMLLFAALVLLLPGVRRRRRLD